jgi:hypothetical protein
MEIGGDGCRANSRLAHFVISFEGNDREDANGSSYSAGDEGAAPLF